MVRPGISTGTLTEQFGSVDPVAQLLPAAAVVIVLARILFPLSGLFTVTVPVTVTVPPTGMVPVHVPPLPLSTSVPDVAVWSPLGTASSNTSLAFVAIVIPVYGVCPV